MRFFRNLKQRFGKLLSRTSSVGKRIAERAAPVIQTAVSQMQTQMPPAAQRYLDAYGDGIVSNLRVARAPIPKPTESLLNSISQGSFQAVKQKYGYDTFYHLYLSMNVNGRPTKVEKNQTVNIAQIYSDPNADYIEIPNIPQISLRQMINNTIQRMGPNFYIYDPFKYNCQNFVMNILEANNLDTPELRNFIMQPLEEVVKDLPGYVPKVARAITDIAGIIDTKLQNKLFRTDGRPGQVQQNSAQNIADADGE